MATFESIFPTFLAKARALHDLLLIVAFMLFIVGVVTTVIRGFTAASMGRYLIRLLVLTSALVFLPDWGNTMQDVVQNSILSGLGIDPANVQDQYNHLLIVKRDATTTHSWWNILSDMSSYSVEVLISALLWVIGQIASFLLYWAYVFQKIILHLGYALSPILIGFMAIRALRSVGSNYLMQIAGVLLWPLGWAVSALVTQGMLDFMTDPSFKFIDPTSTLYTFQETIGVAFLGFWIIFSTVASPIIIQKVLSHGVLMGSELLHGAISSFVQTAATTAGAAAVAAPAGSAVVTGGGAGLAFLMSTLSSSAGIGSAGAIIIAGSGLPPRSARGRPGDDITSDRAVRELIAKSRSQYSGSYAGQ